MSDLRIIRGASNSRFGGIHWYEWKPKDEVTVGPPSPDLLLLHPLPHDGSYFYPLAPCLAAGRTVIAADYPGYGKSDALPGEPSVEDWADAMLDLLAARATHGATDLLGFHSGCLVAAEMSLRDPAAVRRLVLVDVPCFDAERRAELREQHRADDGFHAAFSYPIEERLARVGHDCLVIATRSKLRGPSEAADELLQNSRFVEFPDVVEPALQTGAAPISQATLAFLSAEEVG